MMGIDKTEEHILNALKRAQWARVTGEIKSLLALYNVGDRDESQTKEEMQHAYNVFLESIMWKVP